MITQFIYNYWIVELCIASPRMIILLVALCCDYLVQADIASILKLKSERAKSWLEDTERFQYDIECNWLREDERAIRVAEKRCPPLPPTTSPPPTTTKKSFLPPWLLERLKRRKKKAIFSIRTKRALMSAFSLGGMKSVEIDLNHNHLSHELLSGISLSLTCNEEVRKAWGNYTDTTVTWYVNNQLIQNQKLEWRVTVSTEGILNIWPLLEEDVGNYECAVDGNIMGSGLMHIVSKSEAVINGLYNYAYVTVFYIPAAIYAVILISRDVSKPPTKSKREDKMTAFLEEYVLKNGAEVKENIAKVIYGDQFEERKAEITKTLAAGVGPNGT
ncbi:hypothetical protein Y032_0300g1815 [Ancylostoma ceylanicum]|uniref:Ig-like domain-containing protein n=1 Tax=Ancylostoma ceylanicum TaxID=53326 RepID=A0A016S529_9BILA|nr:hypothetical protein Y032_0300g1815 [Ancylostoma ceylanicum]